jgi:hypothetical protein
LSSAFDATRPFASSNGAGADAQAPRLLGAARAHVHVDLPPLVGRLLPLAARLVERARDGPFAREHLDAAAGRGPPGPHAEVVDGEEAVVAHVRDGEADLVEVREERERRPSPGSAQPRERRAERVALDLGDAAERLAHHLRDGVLVPRGAGRAQQPVEELGDGHCAEPSHRLR